MRDVRSQSLIIFDIGVSDIGRGRNEMRPSGIAFDESPVQQDVRDFSRLCSERDLAIRILGLVDKSLTVAVQEDRTVVKQGILGVLPRNQQPLDHRTHYPVRQPSRRGTHHASRKSTGGQPLLEWPFAGRDKPQLRAVRHVHVDEHGTSVLGKLVSIAGCERVDAFDLPVLLALVFGDHRSVVGIVTGRQDDTASREILACLVVDNRPHAHHTIAVAKKARDRGIGKQNRPLALQTELQRGDVRLGTWYDIVHPRLAVRRLGTWTNERQADASQPLECCRCLAQEKSSHRVGVASFDLNRWKVAGVFDVQLGAVVNASLVLDTCAGRCERTNGDSSCSAGLRTLLEDENAPTMLGRGVGGSQTAATRTDNNHIERHRL